MSGFFEDNLYYHRSAVARLLRLRLRLLLPSLPSLCSLFLGAL